MSQQIKGTYLRARTPARAWESVQTPVVAPKPPSTPLPAPKGKPRLAWFTDHDGSYWATVTHFCIFVSPVSGFGSREVSIGHDVSTATPIGFVWEGKDILVQAEAQVSLAMTEVLVTLGDER